jgi:uncharacterized protein YcbK (DUF882 family)
MTIGCDSSTPLTSRFDPKVLTPNSAIFNTLFEPSLLITSNPLDRVDRTTIIDLTNRLNVLFSGGAVDLTPYPMLKNRVSQFPITYVDTADFVLRNQINAAAVYPVIRDYNPDLSIPMPVQFDSFLSDFDFHLDTNTGSTISSGLCGEFGDIFTKIFETFILINAAAGLISDIINLAELDPLKKAESLTLQETIAALGDAIVEIVKKLVEQAKKQVEAMIAAAVATITGIATSIGELFTKLDSMAKGVLEFFEDDNIDNFLDKIGAYIATMSSQFERLTVENVALLMFRLCQFAELLQGLLMGPANALTALVETVAVESLIAKNSSLKETKSAVEAGATRVSQEDRIAAKSSSVETINSQATNISLDVKEINSDVISLADAPVTPVTPPVTPRPTTGLLENPEQFDWQTRSITWDEYDLIVSLTSAGIPGSFVFEKDIIDNNRWQKVKPVVWAKLVRISNQAGKEFTVTSAFRSKEYNRSQGGATDSIHMSGFAIDIRVSAEYKEVVFLAAQRAGFTGIGIYSSFMHLDCGSRRMWVAGHGSQASSSHPVTGDEKAKWVNAIAKHNADAYRKNAGIPAEQLAQQNRQDTKTLQETRQIIRDREAMVASGRGWMVI